MSGNIPIRNLTAANWVLTGTAVLLSAGRFGIRYKTQRGFHADDYTHLLALLGLLAFSITYQLGFPTFIDVVEISDGTVPEPADFDAVVKRYRQYQTAVSITEWVTLWAVKFTFLLFYRLLFSVSKGFRTAWWLIFVFTALAFWVPITGVLTLCGPIGNFFNADACFSNITGQRIILEYSCVAQVLTDLLIMALPICMLPKIQISWGRKVGLGFVFSIAIVTVALDIVRTVESIGGGAFGYISLYCILETTFTVIISCLPVYPSMVGYLRKERDSRAAAKTSRFNSDGATLVNVTPMGKSKGGSGTDSVGGRSLDFGDEYHDGLALYAHKKTSSEPATRARFEGYDRMSSKESHDTQRANDVV